MKKNINQTKYNKRVRNRENLKSKNKPKPKNKQKKKGYPNNNINNEILQLTYNEPTKPTPKIKDPYENQDEQTITHNKLLPKPCYGNGFGYYCIYKCPHGGKCISINNVVHGDCDCKYQPSCHTPRQYLQNEIKKESVQRGKEYTCSFVKYFEDIKDYPTIEIPKGIIKMKPIEHE